MLRRISLYVAMLMTATSTIMAQSVTHITYFTVSSALAQPVTIKTNLGEHTFSGSFILKGRVEKMEACDVNGNSIHIDDPRIVEGQPTEYHFTLHSYYPGSSPYVYDGQETKPKNTYYFSSGMGEPRGFLAKNDKNWVKKTYAGVGYGTQFGGAWGVSVTTKIAHGALGLTGGIGYDDRLANHPMTWYAALLFGIKGWDIEIGPVSRYGPDKNREYSGLVMMSNISIPLFGPVGVNLGFGYSLSFDEKNPKPIPEANLGLTIRLHQSAW